MYLSRYFMPLLKETPAEAKIVSHRLMLRAGMVRQLSAGIYNWLPLGLTVMKNIETIVRQEMNKAGCVEILMPTLQPKELWQESSRYDDYGQEMLRIQDRHKRDLLYGPTAEEVVTDIFRQNIKSYKDLPLNLYQISWKFRDEIRPRFGVMRGREFLMKDGYSFDLDEEASKHMYDQVFNAYLNTFKRLGLTAIPVKADTGPIGGDLSHEFQVLAKTGESEIVYDKKFDDLLNKDRIDIEQLRTLYAMADDMHDEKTCPLKDDQLNRKRGIEVGHIFHFGDKYTKAMNCTVLNKDGKAIHPLMGSYGIGISRLVGAIIEANHDDDGIIWPQTVAPFDIGLINIRSGDKECDEACESLYQKLTNLGVKVLYDDTNNSAGKKFASMDLIGLPWQLGIGPRGLKDGVVEIKERATGKKDTISFDAVLDKFVAENYN